MGKKKKEIKAVLHLPKSDQALYIFEKRMCNFYAAQVEKRLRPLLKKGKLEVLQVLIDNFNS